VKIVDFGLARQIPDAEFELKVICGTAEFMAPEVLNFDPVTFKSDIW
jgi:myosin-light-chain kinase